MFRPEGKEEIGRVIQRYLKLAIHYDYPFNITKYCLQQLLGSEQDSDHGRAFLACVNQHRKESRSQSEVCVVPVARVERKDCIVRSDFPDAN